MSKNGRINYTVKERLERLDLKIETVNSKVDNLQMNDVRHLSVDLAELKGQLKWIKWLVITVLGFILISMISNMLV
jgi:peptidoglycan hydrolase CwlO-like protein